VIDAEVSSRVRVLDPILPEEAHSDVPEYSFHRIVSRSVVDDDDLEALSWIRLAQERRQQGIDAPALVETGDDDTDERKLCVLIC
jgi:hypothetical protein